MQCTSCEMPCWMNHNLELRLPREISATSDMQVIPLLWKKLEDPKSLLMGVKEERKKTGLKPNIQKTKTMTSGPITPHQIEGEKWEWWQILFSLGSKINVDGDCCHEIKRYLLLRRKTMTNLDSLLKSREITLQKKVHIVKAMIFPVIMYGCESWTLKMIESWRIDVFELSCWRRFLRVPWIARRPNCSTQMKSMLKIHWNTWCWSWGYSILATWYEELTHWKRPDSGKDWTPKETGVAEYKMVRQHHQPNGREFELTLGNSEGQRSLTYYSSWVHKGSDIT